MGWQQQVVTAPVVIIQSGVAGSGLFIYNGAPGPANPPVLAAVAPGVTKDPFGNPVSAVLNIGNLSAAHAGFDQAGIEYLSDSSGTVKIVIDPARGMFFYSGTAALGNPPQLSLALSGVTSDTFGNAIGTSKILIQGNVITESGGIFRTAAAAPLIQLDGPHNAYLEYNGSSVLTETIAPVATTDGLGNTVRAGFTSYFSQTFFTNLNSASLNFADTVNAAFSAGIINLTSVTTADDSIKIGSPLAVSTDIQASLILQRAATPGPAHAIIGNADLRLSDTSPAAPAGGTSIHSKSGHGKSLSSADGNDYGIERLIQVNTTNITLSNTAFVSVFTGVPVAAAAYLIRADLLISVGATASALIFQLVGPAVGAVTNVKWRVTFEAGTGESIFAGHSIGNLNSFTAPSTTFAANSVVHVWLSAYVTFTAASGTSLTLQVELGTASAGSNVSLGSTLEVYPV